MNTPRREIPNVEIEAGYRALVELGAPISRAEIVAVLEAAEGARGMPVETEMERLREQLDDAGELIRSLLKLGRTATDKLAARAFLATLPHPGKEKA